MNVLIITLLLSVKIFSIDVNIASEVGDYCALTFDSGVRKLYWPNKKWCDKFIMNEFKIILLTDKDRDRWCIVDTTSATLVTEWKVMFNIRAMILAGTKTTTEAIKEVLDWEHKCKKKVI